MICELKNKYSKKTAEKTRDYLRETQGIKLAVYQCKICGRWHLSKRTDWQKRWNKKIKKS